MDGEERRRGAPRAGAGQVLTLQSSLPLPKPHRPAPFRGLPSEHGDLTQGKCLCKARAPLCLAQCTCWHARHGAGGVL